MAYTPPVANPIDPKILSILAANNTSGGAPFTSQGSMGSPFINQGAQAWTPGTAPAGGGMSFGQTGQWALPKPAGVSLGYVPTAQTIGSAANEVKPFVLDPKPKPVVAPAVVKPKFNYEDWVRRMNRDQQYGGGSSGGGDRGGAAGYSTSGGGRSYGSGSGSTGRRGSSAHGGKGQL